MFWPGPPRITRTPQRAGKEERRKEDDGARHGVLSRAADKLAKPISLFLFWGPVVEGEVAWACRRHCWATVGLEPVGFQEGKLKIPPSRHGWNPERTGIQFPSCRRRGQGVVTRRAPSSRVGLGVAGGWSPGPGIHWLRPGAGGRGQGRADCYWKPSSSVCLSAKLPTAFSGLLFPGSGCVGPGLARLSPGATVRMSGATGAVVWGSS